MHNQTRSNQIVIIYREQSVSKFTITLQIYLWSSTLKNKKEFHERDMLCTVNERVKCRKILQLN